MCNQNDSDKEFPARHEQRSSAFETTHWSTVLLAAGESSDASREALADLCQAYWLPLYAYVRCHVDDVHRAEDLTQTFFARLLEKEYLRSVNPSKGRFRAFLLTAMKRLMANEWDHQTALKRGGGTSLLCLDFEAADRRYRALAGGALSADKLFIQDWVRTLLHRVFARLEDDYTRAGKRTEFQLLRPFISAADAESRTPDLGRELGRSAGAVRVAIHRLRRHYRKILREEVLQTVQYPNEVDDEIRSLFAAFD